MSLIGKIYTEYRIPGSYHHDHAELPNGDIIALTQDLGSGSVGGRGGSARPPDRECQKKDMGLKDVLPMGAGAQQESERIRLVPQQCGVVR